MAQAERDVLNDIQRQVYNLEQLTVVLFDYDEQLSDAVRPYNEHLTNKAMLEVANEASHQSEVVGALHMILSDSLKKIDGQLDQAFQLSYDTTDNLTKDREATTCGD